MERKLKLQSHYRQMGKYDRNYYLVVDSNGFAQVGDPDYYKKNLVEMNYLLDLINEKFPVPEQFTFTCFFAKKSFPNEFDTYNEITKRIQELYRQSLNTQKAEHLNVVRA
jgi:hypothetical protein